MGVLNVVSAALATLTTFVTPVTSEMWVAFVASAEPLDSATLVTSETPEISSMFAVLAAQDAAASEDMATATVAMAEEATADMDGEYITDMAGNSYATAEPITQLVFKDK